MTTKRRPGPARRPDSAVSGAALRARRSRERRAADRLNRSAAPAGGPSTCLVCGLPVASTAANWYFDDGPGGYCAVSLLRLGDVAPLQAELDAALGLGHSAEELAAAEETGE